MSTDVLLTFVYYFYCKALVAVLHSLMYASSWPLFSLSLFHSVNHFIKDGGVARSNEWSRTLSEEEERKKCIDDHFSFHFENLLCILRLSCARRPLSILLTGRLELEQRKKQQSLYSCRDNPQ